MDITSLIIVLALLLAFGMLMYASLDGFGLGIGIVSLLFQPSQRGRLMDSIAPLWDGNATWIIYFGTIGVAAFPVIYYGILPSLYIPSILMVVGLFMRGLSFEFRLKAKGKDALIWDFTFSLGSCIAAFFQGVLFSSAFFGLNMKDGMYHGGPFDFISLFSIVSGFLTVILYAMLGFCFLRYKTQGEIADFATSKVRILLPISLVGTFCMEYWLLHRTEGLMEHFFSHDYKIVFYSALSILSILIAFIAFRCLKNQCHNVFSFLLAVSLLVISFIKKLVIIWPFVIFPSYTIFTAANTETSLRFTFVVLCLFLPIVLCATGFAYFAFRGKLRSEDKFYS